MYEIDKRHISVKKIDVYLTYQYKKYDAIYVSS